MFHEGFSEFTWRTKSPDHIRDHNCHAQEGTRAHTSRRGPQLRVTRGDHRPRSQWRQQTQFTVGTTGTSSVYACIYYRSYIQIHVHEKGPQLQLQQRDHNSGSWEEATTLAHRKSPQARFTVDQHRSRITCVDHNSRFT